MSDDEQTSRRGFLASAGATGAFLGVGGLTDLGSAFGADRQQNQQVATHYRLGGRTSGWQGIDPASIAQSVNPTLNLQAGEDYAITWENLDGAPHNVAIFAENGDVLVESEIIATQGATQTVRFTASERMTTYICQVHPNTMEGNIALGAQPQQQGANQTTQTPTTIPNPTEAPVEETPNPLADQFGENPLKFIAELQTPPNVEEDRTGADVEASHPEATGARGTTWFTLHPPNGVRAKLMYSLYLQNVSGVTGAAIYLRTQQGDDPVVARLFQPENPTDEIRGTLVDSLITAENLRGPFRDASLLRLVEAIRNDNAYVQVRTQNDVAQSGTTQNGTTQSGTTTQGGSNVILRGPIRALDDEAEAGGNQTTPEETAAGGPTVTQAPEGQTTQAPENQTAGNQTTTDD